MSSIDHRLGLDHKPALSDIKIGRHFKTNCQIIKTSLAISIVEEWNSLLVDLIISLDSIEQ